MRNRISYGLLVVWLLGFPPSAPGQWTAISLNGDFVRSQANAAFGNQIGGVGRVSSPLADHAVIWNGSAASLIDLTPGLSGLSAVLGMSQGQQVGQIGAHAALWTGTPESFIDINPAGMSTSAAFATDGFEQVGGASATPTGNGHAMLWHGTAGSALDLHPAGADGSAARAVAGGQQSGIVDVQVGQGVTYHAALWSGSAASFVDLHPGLGYTTSFVTGMAPGREVGWVDVIGGAHVAAMWSGSAASFVNMDPPVAFGGSEINATSGSAQVGWASMPGHGQSAGIWFGTPESFVNLDAFLPAGEYEHSVATSVAAFNGLYYVGGYAFTTGGATTHAFVWVGVPPPPGAAVLLLGWGFFACRRKR